MTHSEAIEALRKAIPRGAVIYTSHRRMLLSGGEVKPGTGISRDIALFTAKADPTDPDDTVFINQTRIAAEVLGWRFNERSGGIEVDLSHIDHGKHIVYELSKCLYGNGNELHQSWA